MRVLLFWQWSCKFILCTGFVLFRLLKFHDFPWLFPWPFQVFQDLWFSCQFQKSKTFSCFGAFFALKQFNRHKLWRSQKCVPFKLLNIPLYLTSPWPCHPQQIIYQTELQFSMTFKDQQLNSTTFQAWKWNSYIPWLSWFSMTCTNPVCNHLSGLYFWWFEKESRLYQSCPVH